MSLDEQACGLVLVILCIHLTVGSLLVIVGKWEVLGLIFIPWWKVRGYYKKIA